MNDQQLLRYSRHILLNEIDIEGQERILSATILIVGCGGLGNAAAPYLGASGVGNIILADHDVIELSNLQRQVFFKNSDLNNSKAAVLAHALKEQNTDINITVMNKKLTLEALLKIVPKCTVVLDCTDNFATRQAINKACVLSKTPLVSGAATRFDGQLAVFDTRIPDSPCYACLFYGENVEDDACVTFGVFSPLVGVIGAAQAGEALKIITQATTPKLGTLYQYNALNLEFYPIQFPKRVDCPVCGQK